MQGQEQMTAQALMQLLSMRTGQPVGTMPHVQGPGGSLFLSRQQVLMNFNMLFSAVRTAEHTGQYTSAIAGKDPQAANSACKTPLEALRPITIKDLQPFLGRPAKEYKLAVKTIHPPCQQAAVQLLVEDEEGTAINLSLYNMTGGRRFSLRELENRVPVGTKLIVKMPYLKVYASGFPGLRLDHASNLVVVGEDGTLHEGLTLDKIGGGSGAGSRSGGSSKGPYELKDKGNKYFAEGNYEEAVSTYRQALQATTTADTLTLKELKALQVTIHSNTAEALLRLGRHWEAGVEARKAVFIDPKHTKARYRLALAESGVGKHTEALSRLNPMIVESAIAKSESHQSILEAHARIQERLEDARGHFRLPPDAMSTAEALALAETEAHTHAKSFFSRLKRGDVATYIGPLVIRPTGDRNKGRGLFVTENVKTHTVLLCEKALAHVAEKEKELFGGTINYTTWQLDIGGHTPLREAAAAKSLVCPASNARLLAMFDGHPSDGGRGGKKEGELYVPSMDLFRFNVPPPVGGEEGEGEGEEIFAAAAAASSSSSGGKEGGADFIDMDRLSRVVRFNGMGFEVPRPQDKKAKNKKKKNKPSQQGEGEEEKTHNKNFGLYALASFINHAKEENDSNVVSVHVGDYLLLRASRPLEAGEEVLLDYLQEWKGEGNRKVERSREDILEEIWGFH